MCIAESCEEGTAMTIFALLFSLPVIATATQLTLGKQHYIKAMQIIYSILFLLLSIYLFFFGDKLTIIHLANWPAPYGIVLAIDHLARLMLLVFSVVFTCINIFSLTDSTLKNSERTYYSGAWLLVLGVIGALTTYDIFNLYVWSEVILVSAFIILSISQKNNSINIWHYAIFNITGTLLMLLAIGLLYGLTGNLNAAAIAQYLTTTSNSLIMPIVTLLFLGLAIKGGIFPFYFWLPTNYPNTSASSTLLISSLVTKVIMLVILRLFWLWQPLQSSSLSIVFIVLACCTMFFGVMGAANEFRLRHILSFHIVSQIGYILLAIFIPTSQAIMATLYFLIHNIFVKTNLLMTSGIIEERYQTNKLTEMGGNLKACPLLAAIFFLSAMSLAGFPPLSGFWGKLLIFKSAFNNHLYIPLIIAILVSLLTLYSMTKIWRCVYCEASSIKSHSSTFKLTKIQLLALLPLLLIPIIMGLYPSFLIPPLQHITDQLSHPHAISNAILGTDQ